jgi:3-dehydroquinate synthase
MTSDDVTTIHVDGTAPYDVLIGHGVTGRVASLLDEAHTVAVVRPASLIEPARVVVKELATAGFNAVELTVPDGEAGKSLSALHALWDDFGDAGVGRRDAVVAVGGGATTDVAGFAAATWLRGVRVVHVPTTLLAMVDAAVGGKTGINTPAGKNLAGAFHPPAGVIVDLDTLDSLPQQQWVNGMAEVVKAGFIADAHILELVESDFDAARRPDGTHTRELLERSIAVKAAVVSRDLREAGPREALNYGHTLGHAVEKVEEFRWPHGHAVSVGLVYAAALSHRIRDLASNHVTRHRSVLDGLGLPTSYRRDAWPQLHTAMQQDKKSRAGALRFVVLDDLAKPVVVEAPGADVLEAVYDEVTP